jgi:hypothetical protein
MDQVLNFLDDLTNGELTNLRAANAELELKAERAAREKAVFKLRLKNMDFAEISDCTGFSIAEIQQILG